MKSNSQLPTIESVEKEFDEKFFYHGTVKKMIKSFYRQKLTEILKAQRQELKKKVEGMKVSQEDIDRVDEKYKLIYNSHNETIDMFLKLLEERKE